MFPLVFVDKISFREMLILCLTAMLQIASINRTLLLIETFNLPATWLSNLPIYNAPNT